MAEDELKPCPFCGCPDIRIVLHRKAGGGLDHRGDDVYSIGCYGCGGSVPSRYNEYGRGLLVESWNKRFNAPA